MAKLDDERIQAVFAPHLNPGEELKYWAFGVRQPSLLVIVPLIALAILPGVIAVAMLTRNYLIGLTGERLIVLQIKGIGNGEVKEITEYDLSELTAANASAKTGGLFTHIAITDPDKPFKAKFHRAFSKNNRPHAVAIGEAIAG